MFVALSLNGGPMEVMDGSKIEVTCKSSRGKPPASLRWLDGAGAEIEVTESKDGEKNIEQETEDIPDSKIKTQVSQPAKLPCDGKGDKRPKPRSGDRGASGSATDSA